MVNLSLGEVVVPLEIQKLQLRELLQTLRHIGQLIVVETQHPHIFQFRLGEFARGLLESLANCSLNAFRRQARCQKAKPSGGCR